MTSLDKILSCTVIHLLLLQLLCLKILNDIKSGEEHTMTCLGLGSQSLVLGLDLGVEKFWHLSPKT